MMIFRFITTLTMVCLVSHTLAEPVYSLKVNGKDVPVIEFDAKYDYALFSSDGACTLEVTRLDGQPVAHHSISPLKLKIEANAAGPQLKFRINQPEYLIVDIPDLRKLVIAIDPAERDIPAA